MPVPPLCRVFDFECEAVYLGDRVVVVAGKPTTVIDDIAIDLGARRDQIQTKADPRFTALRSRVMTEILAPRHAVIPLRERQDPVGDVKADAGS